MNAQTTFNFQWLSPLGIAVVLFLLSGAINILTPIAGIKSRWREAGLMSMMKSFYNITYSRFRAPWDIGPRKELVELVESGRIQPCKAIDLGSGTASNCVFLAQRGFDVTGVDYAAAAVELGRKRAAEAGVTANFIQDDLTPLRHVTGTFDLLVDYGTLDDLKPSNRELYLRNVLLLARPGSRFVLYCFEWTPRWWERPFFFSLACEPGEIERRFGPHFHIECYGRQVDYSRWPAGYAVYLMTRKGWTT
ncbi:MAG: class I SAM-dependent methyltransferase [Chloroflexi bacterium]|nr:class I SAM-dependent methyltransferase [Chloroflexota bacterium]